MSKFIHAKNSFTSGQVGEKFHGRFETKEYQDGAKSLENFLALRAGGIAKRPGSRFLLDNAMVNPPRLIPFIFSKTESYMIAIDYNATLKIKIYKNDGTLATTNLGSGAFNPFAALYNTTWDNFGWKYAQAGDLMFLTHSEGIHPPLILVRDSADNFTVYNFLDSVVLPQALENNSVLRRPYLNRNTDGEITLRPSATTGSIALFAEDSGGGAISFFDAKDDDNNGDFYLKLNIAGVTGIVRVTAYVSASQVTATVVITLGGTARTDDWRMAAFGGRNGYPKTVTHFENRVVFGGTLKNKDRVFGSLSDNRMHFMENRLLQDASSDVSGLNYFGSPVESDPLSFVPSANEINEITWISGEKTLQIGTLGAEYSAGGGEFILSRESLTVRRQTSYGGKSVQPVRVDKDVLFVSRDGKRIRGFRFSEENGSYFSVNFNLLADDIFNFNFGTTSVQDIEIIDMAYQPSRGVIWALTNHNELVSLTLAEDGKLRAWSRHQLGGVSDANGTNTKIFGIASIPNSDGSHDDLWISTKRYINSTAEFYLEKIGQDFEHTTLNPDTGNNDDLPWYLDAAIFVDLGAGGTAVGGLSHLEGETVQILADGEFVGTEVVAAGAITLDNSAEHVIVGLAYTPLAIPLPLEAGQEFGSSMGQIKRIDRATLRLYKSRYVEVGSADQSQFDLVADSDELVTGERRIHVPQGHDTLGQIAIRQQAPYPLTILAVAYRGMTFD